MYHAMMCMSNERYTGTSAKVAKEEQIRAAKSFRESIDPVAEVNKIAKELGLDESYFVGSNGMVSQAYESIQLDERRNVTEKIQEKIVENNVNNQKTSASNSVVQRAKGSKIKPRYDRLFVAGMAVTLLTSMGFSAVKHAITGARGRAEITKDSGDFSISDSISDERVSDDVVILKDEPENVPQIMGENKTTKAKESEQEDDRVAYIVDFSDYYNKSQKEHIFEMIDNKIIDGIGFEIGASCIDYPFKIRTFDDEYIGTYVKDHIDNGELILKKSMGEIEWLEEYIVRADSSIPYYYSCALNDEEAEIEADCIEAVYKKLNKDLPDYNFKGRMAPIVIDIERSGDERMKVNGSDEEMQRAMEQRTDAVLHLIDCLQDRGVIDDRGVIIYGDLNRMEDHSHINWERLFSEIKERDIHLTKWGSRAFQTTFHSGIKYEDVYAFQEALMNTPENISYMKDYYDHLYPYLGDIAMQQIHLDQEMETSFTYEEYFDVNITTANTWKAIVSGKEINYEKNFIDRLEEASLTKVRDDLKNVQAEISDSPSVDER